jgi:hypothetical protein
LAFVWGSEKSLGISNREILIHEIESYLAGNYLADKYLADKYLADHYLAESHFPRIRGTLSDFAKVIASAKELIFR